MVLRVEDEGRHRDDSQVFRGWVIPEESTGRRDLASKIFSTLGVESLKYLRDIKV